jgi:hypothetical protein
MKTIRVTQKHIANGKTHDCFNCPVALALDSAGLGIVKVDKDGFFIDPPLNHTRYISLPQIAKNFISRFDSGLPVKPITFKLNL